MFTQTFSISSRRALQETDLNSIATTPRSFTRNWWSLKGSHSYKTDSSHVANLQQKFSLAKYLVVVTAGPGTPSLSILSQVYGGPLRSVHSVTIAGFPSLLLEFQHEHHAETCRNFIDYQKCSVFGVTTIQSEVVQQHLDIIKPRSSAIQKVFARRTLEFSQETKHGSSRPFIINRKMNPLLLMKVFGAFGEVLEVRPMFLKGKVGFSIEFADLEDAIKAKDRFDDELSIRNPQKTEGSEIKTPKPKSLTGIRHFNELHEWKLAYTRDNSERNSCH